MEHITNEITLRGVLQNLPVFSHENHGKRFFRLYLEVPRLSGAVDILPVIVEEGLLGQLDPTAGAMLTVTGQVRSHNQRTDGVRHLMIFVFASSIVAEDGEPINDVILEGPLCREPNYWPCILWGRIAQEVSHCHTRDVICIHGRLQSRVYTKQTENGPQERTAYEISALTAEIVEEDLY